VSYRLDRYEFKFLITRAQRDAIIGQFPEHIVPDRNSGPDAGYRIYTLYYDSPERDCYWEKLRGLGSRRKLRVRLYESALEAASGACFVEIKHKHDGRGVKRRVLTTLTSAMKITGGLPSSAPLRPGEERVVSEVRQFISERNFVPICCMRYDRKAFMDAAEDSDLRITFDEDIRYRMDDLESLQNGAFENTLLNEDESVMEVKVTGAVPIWLTRILSAEKCTPAGRSKYCDAIAASDALARSAA
jgi:hypothetical protein